MIKISIPCDALKSFNEFNDATGRTRDALHIWLVMNGADMGDYWSCPCTSTELMSNWVNTPLRGRPPACAFSTWLIDNGFFTKPECERPSDIPEGLCF